MKPCGSMGWSRLICSPGAPAEPGRPASGAPHSGAQQTGRPLQVVRVTVEATDPAEAGLTARLRVMGAGADTPAPFSVTLGGPGESRTGEVSVAVTGSPGIQLPVTVIAETDGARAELGASVTVAEPGWTMWMVSHFHYDPVWWNTQGQFTEARLVLPDEDGDLPDMRTAFDLVRLHLEKARRDPDYKFVLAEVDYLKPHFDAFPRDRAFLRSLLADGRAELVGGTYNEPNTNLTGAETTIRNAVYGMGFQRGVLGAEPALGVDARRVRLRPGVPRADGRGRADLLVLGARAVPPVGAGREHPDAVPGRVRVALPRRRRPAHRVHGQPLRRGLGAAHGQGPARGPGRGLRAVPLAGPGRRHPQRDAAGRLGPRDPGPLGDRRRPGVVGAVPVAAVHARHPAGVLRRGAGASRKPSRRSTGSCRRPGT